MRGLSITRAAFEEAKRLGHSWVGPEHGLLAILRGEPDDIARRALEEAGVDADRFEAWYVECIERSDPPPKPDPGRGISPNPAWYGAVGRAEGFAAAVGRGTVRPADLLIALLWHTRKWLPLREFGVTREAVVANLARAGVKLPAAPLPDLDQPMRKPTRVDFPASALDRVLALLAERHPPGSGRRWGFNHDEAVRAWAFAEEGIDLQGIVDEAIAEQADPQ